MAFWFPLLVATDTPIAKKDPPQSVLRDLRLGWQENRILGLVIIFVLSHLA